MEVKQMEKYNGIPIFVNFFTSVNSWHVFLKEKLMFLYVLSVSSFYKKAPKDNRKYQQDLTVSDVPLFPQAYSPTGCSPGSS